jgi:CubicO group peptidase (beta-lactamase class C family)
MPEPAPTPLPERSVIVNSFKEEAMSSSAARLLLVATAVLLLCTPALHAAPGEEAPAGVAATTAQAAGPTDPAELEAFIDGMMAAHMRSQDIPAATIAVVRDGRLLFAKGYGFQDREKRIPVVADRTLFRPGSTSKLFTWTAVMQLYERGQLDLEADVNTYLKDFKIPATYPQPITMKNLLAHTPGFEDGSLGFLIVKDASGLMPMRKALALHIPERVRPPGTWSSYSNYGAALAGLVVEYISGMPFDEYIKKNIFDPLGMEHSTFHEPLPANLAPDMAVGYKWKNGLYEPGYFEFISNFGPAGALSATATDMAAFMIAHLQLGRYGDNRILKEETTRLMHSRLYAPDPRLPGMDYGLYQSDVYGQSIIGHAGDTNFFHSELALFPEHNVGLFVSYATHGGHARMELVEAFVMRYFHAQDPPLPKPPENFAKEAAKFAGKYRFTRHNWSTIEKVLTLPMVLTVAVTKEGTLALSGLFEAPLQWVQVAPSLFRQIDGPLKLGFTEDKTGRVTHMVISNWPFMPTYRIEWYTDPALNYALVGLAVLLCLTTLKSAFKHRKERKGDPAPARWAVRLAVSVSVLTLLFLVAVVVIVSVYQEDLFSGLPSSLTVALMLPIIASLLTLGVAAHAVLAWRRGYWTRWRRVHYTLFALFAIGLVWFYWFWNILGVKYG